MSIPRYRIQATPPPKRSPMHVPPSFIPNRQYLPHFNGPTQHARPRMFNHFTPPLKQFIEMGYYGLPAVYHGFPGELDFDYSKFVGKQSYHYPQSEYGPPQRAWQDVNPFCKDHDVSTDFCKDNAQPESKTFNGYSLPTDETFVSEYDSDHDSDSSSTTHEQNSQRRSSWNWRNAQYDSDATSPDESSDDSSEYYDSDSEDEWCFPPRFQNNPLPSGLTLKEAVLSYEQRWNSMLTQRGGHHQLTFETVPWPQYPPPRSPTEINYRSIREFLRAAGGPSSFMLKTIFRQTMLRFHPDKSAVLLAHVDEHQRRLVFEGCTAVTRCLNDIRDLF